MLQTSSAGSITGAPVRGALDTSEALPNLRAHVLRFEGHAERPVRLNEHKGSALRGALFHALRGRPELGGGFCVRQELPSCHPCDLHTVCPISALVATVSDGGPRGVDPPRPFTIEPPLELQTDYAAGAPFSFGLTLFSSGIRLLPYVVSAVRDLRRVGIGLVPRNGGTRGTFALERIVAWNPLTGEEQVLLSPGGTSIALPDLAVTSDQVFDAASRHAAQKQISLELLTPLRLVDQGQLVHRLAFRPLIHRLVERSLALGGADVDTRPFRQLLGEAEVVRVAEDETRWVELDSYSTRRDARAPLSGLTGCITFAGDLAPFLPWLVWGQVMHVGKEATKGNGWYRIR